MRGYPQLNCVTVWDEVDKIGLDMFLPSGNLPLVLPFHCSIRPMKEKSKIVTYERMSTLMCMNYWEIFSHGMSACMSWWMPLIERVPFFIGPHLFSSWITTSACMQMFLLDFLLVFRVNWIRSIRLFMTKFKVRGILVNISGLSYRAKKEEIINIK